MNKDLTRRVLLVVVSALDWIFSIGSIRAIYNVMAGQFLIEYADNVNIDGSDFSPVVNAATAGINVFVILFTIVLAALFVTIFILIFAILLRTTTIGKKDIITESEVIFAKWVIMVSSVYAFIVGIFFSNIRMIGYVIGLSWQQPLFMMLMYYIPLKKRFEKGGEMDHSEL